MAGFAPRTKKPESATAVGRHRAGAWSPARVPGQSAPVVARRASSGPEAERDQAETPERSGCACGAQGAVSDPCPGCRKVLASAAGLPPSGLNVSSPSDPAEREAEALADRVLAPSSTGVPAVAPVAAAGAAAPGGSGQPLPPGERAFFEGQLGYELSPVRVHADRRAAEAARALHADAFTVRGDVAFGEGRYQPGSADGRRLLAHELVHVIQQGAVPPLAGARAVATGTSDGNRIARRMSDGGPEPAASVDPAGAPAPAPAEPTTAGPVAKPAPVAGAAGGGLIVDDEARSLLGGQERKSAFLAELRVAVCAAADQALARAGRDTRGCPYVERWLGHYANQPAAHLERAIRKFAPGAAGVTSASAYVPLVAARIARGVESWAATGEIPDDIPDELRAELPGGGGIGGALSGVAGAVGGAVSAVAGAVGGALSAIGHLFFKEGPPGAARDGVDRTALSARLGGGRPLEGPTRARMEDAFGRSFDGVRVHDDAAAAGLSRDLGARAFTLGEHVVFSEHGYRPGTPLGDALLAHELAHVGQQGEARAAAPAARTEAAPFERDADRAAADAVGYLHGSGGRPRARTALGGAPRLQRCATAAPRPTALPPNRSHRTFDVDAYVAMWEAEHGRKMTDAEKISLTRGCIGITVLNLQRGNIDPPLDMSFATFAQAKGVADALNDILRSRPPVDTLGDAVNGNATLSGLKNVLSSFPMDPDPDKWQAVIFSKRFYSNQEGTAAERAHPDPTAFRPDDKGQVDMSSYKYKARPGAEFTNFDYAWYDEKTDSWWHANHCQPYTSEAGSEYHQSCDPGMKVYQSTPEHYARPLGDFDRQVFVVAFARKPS